MNLSSSQLVVLNGKLKRRLLNKKNKTITTNLSEIKPLKRKMRREKAKLKKSNSRKYTNKIYMRIGDIKKRLAFIENNGTVDLEIKKRLIIKMKHRAKLKKILTSKFGKLPIKIFAKKIKKKFFRKLRKNIITFKNKKLNFRRKSIKRKNLKRILFFKNDVFYFLRKLFNSFIKRGKKYSVINYFLKIFFYFKLKTFNKKVKKIHNKVVFLYFYKILNNIIPIFIYTNVMFRGVNRILPWVRKNRKINRIKILKIATSWVKKSIVKRKEKTLFFKIMSELEDIRKNKGESIKSKNDYYLDFCKNKQYVRFLRKRTWL